MKKQAINIETSDNAQDVLAIQAVLAGNTNAFEIIYNKYFGHIFRSMSQKLSFNNTVAEDLTMETMAKVYTNLSKYQSNGTFNSWITKVAQNTLLDYIRTEAKHKQVSSYDAALSNDDTERLNKPGSWQLTSDVKNPEQLMTQEEQHKALYKAIRAIPHTNMRQCVVLFSLKEMSLEEVSTKIGLPLGTVKVYIKRGKDYIKNQLEQVL